VGKAPVRRYLQRVIGGGCGKTLVTDVVVSRIGTQELRGQDRLGGRVDAGWKEIGSIRDRVEILLPGKMACERAVVGDIQHGPEADRLLDAETEVHHHGNLAGWIERQHCRWEEHASGAQQAGHVAVVNAAIPCGGEALSCHNSIATEETEAALLSVFVNDLAEWSGCSWGAAMSCVRGPLVPICTWGAQFDLQACLDYVASMLPQECAILEGSDREGIPHLVVPIIVAEHIHGVLAFCPKKTASTYTAADRKLMLDVAALISNLMQSERLACFVADSRFYPSSLPRIEGLDSTESVNGRETSLAEISSPPCSTRE
jgi:hypothetical protein